MCLQDKFVVKTSGYGRYLDRTTVRTSRQGFPSLSDNTQGSEVLLVDANGRPLLTKEPRPIGFRRR